MTPAQLASFRRKIGDNQKTDSDVIEAQTGDRQFELRFNRLNSLVISKNGNAVDPADYTADMAAGSVLFDAALTAGDKLQFDYTFAAYTDDELNELYETYGMDQAVVEVITELIADAARFYDYSQAATDSKKSQVFDHLKDLLKIYTDKAASGGYKAPDGSSMGSMKMGKRIHSAYTRQTKFKPDLSRDDIL